jgi:N-acetylneuraminic acid mutarotase
MPRAVTSFGAAELGGFVYAFGGYSGTPHAYQREGQSGELWRLHPTTREFELMATSEPTQGAALVGARGALLRIGGMRARNGPGEPAQVVSIDEVASFAPGATGWSSLPALPSPRSSHAAAVIGDIVYVVGGWKLAGSAQAGTFADTLIALDLKTKRYSALAQPFALRALAAAPLDGKLVVVGGLDAQANVSRAVHVFDPASATWHRASDLPVDGFGVAASSTGDVLYASASDGTLYALSDPNGPWRAVGSLALPRFFHQLVALGQDRVLALGGISGMHAGPRIRQVESIEIGQRDPSVMSFVLSNPLRGRNRQGAFVHADSLYVFGGNRSLAQHDFAPEDFVHDAARLDLAALRWAPIAKLPVARQTMQTLVEQNGALVLGGFGHDGKVARAHSEALRYELERDRWSSDASSLPSARTQFGLTSVDGVRWLFGGLDFKPGAQGEAQFEHPTSVLCAAPNEPFRASGIDLRQPRRAFGGALLAGRYYLVGGMASGFEPVQRCEAFEFASSSWHDIACPSKTRISPQLVALDGKLYLAGGSSIGEGGQLLPNTSLEVFNPASNSWSTLLEPIPIEPRHLTMLRYRRALLLYSAHDEQGRVHVALITPRAALD